MATKSCPIAGASTLAEMKEFAAFGGATQRYIRRSLDIGFGRNDALETWSRDADEAASIRAQKQIYTRLDEVRQKIPRDNSLSAVEQFLAPLMTLTAFDICQGKLTGFAPYKFLYERLLGAEARPWLSAAFCATASMPQLHPLHRRHLLQSIGEADAMAPNWSIQTPAFYPEWVEKVDGQRAAH